MSLSDLRIPPRISSAQAKIGQDLQRVKEFKDGVEELKKLRKIYRSLVTAEDSDTSASCSLADVTRTEGGDGAGAESEALDIPVEATAKVDHIFARVAVDYRQWWEIADVLINLADGAEVEEIGDSSDASPSHQRARCKSEMPARTGSSSPTPASRVSTSSSVDRILDAEGELSDNRQSLASDEGVDVSTSTSPVAASTTPLPLLKRSPPVLTRSQSTSVFPTRTDVSNSSISATTDNGVRDGERKFGSPRSQSLNASERQLEILRSMLKNSSSTSTNTPPGVRPGYLASVAEKSAPSSPVPSRLTAKPYLSPEKRLPTSFSLPAGLGTIAPASTPTAASESAAPSLPMEKPKLRERQESGKSKVETVSSKGSGSDKKSKSRLREVSRAGMQGIRDFLKALTKSGASITVDPTSPASSTSPSIRFVEPPALPAAGLRTPTGPNLSMTRRVVSDSPIGSIRHSCGQHVGHQRTPVGNILSSTASLAVGDTRGSPLSLASRSSGSSDEEEDWDRHSSDDEDANTESGGGPLLRSDTQATILASKSGGNGLPEQPTSRMLAGGRRKSDGPQAPGAGGSCRVITTTLRLPAAVAEQAGTKLVMTTEAMPTLLAKIDEVKLHCSSCVTELR